MVWLVYSCIITPIVLIPNPYNNNHPNTIQMSAKMNPTIQFTAVPLGSHLIEMGRQRRRQERLDALTRIRSIFNADRQDFENFMTNASREEFVAEGTRLRTSVLSVEWGLAYKEVWTNFRSKSLRKKRSLERQNQEASNDSDDHSDGDSDDHSDGDSDGETVYNSDGETVYNSDDDSDGETVNGEIYSYNQEPKISNPHVATKPTISELLSIVTTMHSLLLEPSTTSRVAVLSAYNSALLAINDTLNA